MGQNASNQSSQPSTQRIRPTPGTSGRRNRKGMISVYCENTHSIFNFSTHPGMTIGEVKTQLPYRNCELKISESYLPNSATLGSLGIDNKTLLRMVVDEKHSQKSNSTVDSLHEQDQLKVIGPKQKLQDKPLKPNHESISSLMEDITLPLNLKIYSVPDIKLEKSHAISCKKPLH